MRRIIISAAGRVNYRTMGTYLFTNRNTLINNVASLTITFALVAFAFYLIVILLFDNTIKYVYVYYIIIRYIIRKNDTTNDERHKHLPNNNNYYMYYNLFSMYNTYVLPKYVYIIYEQY